MARNFLILATALFLFSIVSCGLGWHASMSPAGALPGDTAMWRSIALVLMVFALLAAVAGTMLTLFGQVRRRDQEERDRSRRFGQRRIK